MGKVLMFFLNALKAIVLSPFYILILVVSLILSLLNHIYGEIRVILSGFKYGSKKENKYEYALAKKKAQVNKGQ